MIVPNANHSLALAQSLAKRVRCGAQLNLSCLLALLALVNHCASSTGAGSQDEGGDQASAEQGDPSASDTEMSESQSETDSVDDSASDDGTQSDEQSDSNDDDSKDEDSGDDGDDGPNFDLGSLPDFDPGISNCEIDFLFVVDNSDSMLDEQKNLADSVPAFIDTLTKEIKLEDFHIGIVTSDDYWQNGWPCAELGSLVTKTGGMGSSNAMCGPYADGFNFMTRADDLGRTFTCAARPGVEGDGNERPMQAIEYALDPDMMTAGACNENFVREDAVLVVVTISDEEDDHPDQNEDGNSGSSGDPKDWHANVLKAKGNREEYAVALSLIGIEPPNECPTTNDPGTGGTQDGAERAPRIQAFTELFGERGIVGDVCAPNYDPFFERALDVIKFACDSLPEG